MEDYKCEILKTVSANLDRLDVIWQQIGIMGDVRNERILKCIQYHMEIEEAMINEDQTCLDNLTVSVAEKEENASILSKQLCLSLPIEFSTVKAKSLLEREEYLVQLLEELGDAKRARLESYEKILIEEVKLCKLLGATPLEGPPLVAEDSSQIPSEQDILDLSRHVSSLEAERVKRSSTFHSMRRHILCNLEQLEVKASTDRQMLVVNVPDVYPLDEKSLTFVQEWFTELETMKAANEKALRDIKPHLFMLWDCLEVSEETRASFLMSHNLISAQTIQSFQRELVCCQQQRLDNMAQFICCIREDLKVWWEKCCVSEEECEQFVAAKDETFTEEVLQLHEAELLKWKNYYQENAVIYARLEKRVELFEQWKAHKLSMLNPDRLNNRGGKLLQEEKLGKKLDKDLIKLDNEIQSLIDSREVAGAPFTIFGRTFGQYIELQMAIFNSKENKKETVVNKSRKRQAAPSTFPSNLKQARLQSPASTTRGHRMPLRGQQPSMSKGYLGSKTPGKTPAKDPAVRRQARKSLEPKRLDAVSSCPRNVPEGILVDLAVPDGGPTSVSPVSYDQFSEDLAEKNKSAEFVFNSTSAD